MNIKEPGGPNLPWDNPFVETVSSTFGMARDMPPTHPSDNLSFISDEEVKEYVDKKTSRNLMTFGKYTCCAALFDISKSEQLEAYETIMNNSLHKNWVICVEDRNWSQEGSSMIIFLKYLIPADKTGVSAAKPSPNVHIVRLVESKSSDW